MEPPKDIGVTGRQMTPEAPEPSISAYIQCYSNKAALYHCLKSFRSHYPHEGVTLVSDCGEDFSLFAGSFRLTYYRSPIRCDPRGRLGTAGIVEYLRRIYEHCVASSSDFVVLLEEDVVTYRRIRYFPSTDSAGPRLNPFTSELNAYLQCLNNAPSAQYGYALCGGSVFRRRAYIDCFNRQTLDLGLLATLDERVGRYSDAALTLVFLINGCTYGVWPEVSERHHPLESMRIERDAAFDHNDKRWYGCAFDNSLLKSDI